MENNNKNGKAPKINGKSNFNGGKNNGKIKKIFEFKIDLSPKNIILWILIFLLGLSLLSSVITKPVFYEKKPLSTILNDIKNKKVSKIEVEDSKLTVFYKNKETFISWKETNDSFIKILDSAKIDPKSVSISIKDTSLTSSIVNILGNVLPLVLMVVFFAFIFRQARGAQDSLFSFGASRAKLFDKGKQKITFADVAGVDEAKKELEEVVDFLKHSAKYRALGARTPKGVLLIGPSGSGKTLLAKAVAGEANVPFFSMAGSEFMEMLVGVGASRVRDLFSTAKKTAPAIIFIDEVDSIGRTRSMIGMSSHDEREQTLNQILVEMDGFQPNENIVVIAATNRPDLLDSALIRPGRFDRRVMLDLPDIEGRKAILLIHMKGKPFENNVDWDKMAKRTVGFSGADLENMLNEAAILAASLNKKAIDMTDLEEAATKVKLGPEKKRLQSDLDKKMTAYHETGHAIVTHLLPNMDPVHRISIVSRGLALGYTLIPPAKDRYTETQSHLLSQIASLLGGRAAEEIEFNELTAGASSDISKATQMAREMVISFGMSALGPINFGPQIDISETGRMFYENQPVSQDMQGKIDSEVKKIIDEAYIKAVNILKENKAKLDLVSGELVKKETVEGDEFKKLMESN